jgi:uncharacterized protein with HEPN domain
LFCCPLCSKKHVKFIINCSLVSCAVFISFDEFLADEKTIDAVIRNFEIICEVANRLSDDIRDTFTAVDWYRLKGFRNRIVHDYIGIDYGIVWNIKTDFLPPH